ncbi:DnaJ C-terminal domain-containing protein [Pseudoduganella plicata]|uniref:Curved DNA-binding protein n=1 Tax=Pseudoduganella plicata TaxID=321984 RepID=A0A4V1AUC5_9BURK|nr:DnaJ C-terminal domain-containing protein [Pseudoduganella plicata]QBQ38688.1 J domain-containing protein [Pseudoduganella plicata]GGY84278.1 curved DNA-binding protein [Pseudoduganella plicata]
MEYKDYYATLGVPKTASEDEIKNAYRKLVRKYHPDVSRETDADAKTKELNEAYGVLGDAEKRAAYDELGNAPRQAGQGFRPPPGWGADFEKGAGFETGDDSDFFKDLFAHVGGRRRQTFHTRGDDSHATIRISLHDSYHGAARTITLRVPEHDAQGRVVTRARTLNVTIPKGVTPGQQLRLAGQGHPGAGGAASGDLYLEIEFAPDARYRIDGRDVHETVPVAPWEAMLGAQIDLPTPSGRVTVTVPPGSQTGRKLRLKGRGIPAAGSAAAGDLYLMLEVALPPADTAAARALYEQMARELTFDPRANLGIKHD